MKKSKKNKTKKNVKKNWKFTFNSEVIIFKQGKWNTRFQFFWIFRSPLTANNTVISPNFVVWKFCGKAQFLHSFGRITRNYSKTVSFHKISTPANYVELLYFLQCLISPTVWTCFIFWAYTNCVARHQPRYILNFI